MTSVLVPVLYVLIVFGSLLIFSSYYRCRNARKTFEPYFPSHEERNVYFSLLQMSDPPAPETLLKAALVRRAMTDVTRIIRIREDKPALQNLLQKGSIGDDLWNSLLAAEKELEAEILEVAAEANAYVEGWGSVIFQTATEMMHNEKMRSLVEKIPAIRAEAERKYGKYPLPTLTVEAPPPTLSGNNSAVSSPSTPARPLTPVSPAMKSNGLAPPGSANSESGAFSDSERSVSPTPSSPGKSPKSPSKKSKKRK
ncbi:Pre protein translocase subunit Sec66-domain-containing protein [Epithele typhae]|uniref:Pre protein translocase subunit Sec66-domain-containing protein n=1 Tax=Epithele typhae TaxID=378194 RepID=UPI002007A2BD|nr:Pre protein translocase subunit Sec66-domain-containing protein [Epithele typhae]KAH9946023.1 Pre protein translocase subunit Sec66-domain-containing protein [Epithele typhae]